jgi:hypothetical protein
LTWRRGPGGPYGDLLRVLELLAEQVGTDFDPAQAWAALQGVDARDGFVSAVKRAAARMGLRAQAVRADGGRAARSGRPDAAGVDAGGLAPRAGAGCW